MSLELRLGMAVECHIQSDRIIWLREDLFVRCGLATTNQLPCADARNRAIGRNLEANTVRTYF